MSPDQRPIRAEIREDVLFALRRETIGQIDENGGRVQHRRHLLRILLSLLRRMPSEHPERYSSVLNLRAGEKEMTPQLVVHAVVIGLIQAPDTQSQLAWEQD